jgi:hypothetical protein
LKNAVAKASVIRWVTWNGGLDTWQKGEIRKEYSGTMRQVERNTMRAGTRAKAKVRTEYKNLDRELNNITELELDNMLV